MWIQGAGASEQIQTGIFQENLGLFCLFCVRAGQYWGIAGSRYMAFFIVLQLSLSFKLENKASGRNV